MKYARRLIPMILLVATSASAEFTDQEKGEISRIVFAFNTLGSTMKPLGDSIRDHTNETTRPLYYEALKKNVDAGWQCFQAMRHLLNSLDLGFGAMTREEIVQQGFVHAQNCDTELMAYADALDAVAAVQSNPNIPRFADSVRGTTVGNLNTTLPYTDYRVESYPRVVGPHGDFTASQKLFEKGFAHAIGALANASAFYGQIDVFPDEGAVDIREVIRYWNEVYKHGARAWALDSGIEAVRQDIRAIDDDVAAGSGLRGRPFFRLLREVELIPASEKVLPLLFSERSVETGLTGLFNLSITEFPKAIGKATAINTIEEMERSWLGTKTGLDPPTLVRRNQRMLLDFYSNIGDSWAAYDAWVKSVVMFFHTIPAPPSGGGFSADFCLDGTMVSESQDGCIAEPCPTCPPANDEVIVDNRDVSVAVTGTWIVSSGPNPWSVDSVYCNSGCTFRWIPSLEAGTYEVLVWYTTHPNRITNVPYRIQTPSGLTTVLVDQTTNTGQWFSVGVHELDENSWVEISSENGQANADAVRFVAQ